MMIRQAKRFGFVEGDGFRAIELPYDGGEFSMVILLPDSGHFEKFEELLSVQKSKPARYYLSGVC